LDDRKFYAFDREDGKTKAGMNRRLFGSPLEGGGSVGNDGDGGGKSFLLGESSRTNLLTRRARQSRVVTGNSSDNISNSNILNCNRLFWSRRNH